jgi:L-alanine-DL-glutamate epimerase-like enolase superfamily enzyme
VSFRVEPADRWPHGRGGPDAAAPDRIVAVDITRCALPLERPVHVGATRYDEREYVAVRLRTIDGTEGHAIGYTRGLPLDAMVELLAPALLGGRVPDRSALLDAAMDANVNAMGALWRAVSLLDIALFDASARRLGQPLWRLVGGARSRVPLMAVGGYHAVERGVDAVVAEIRGLIDAGFGRIKLHTAELSIVERVKAVCGDGIQLGVDLGMVWRTLPEAVGPCTALDELELAFIEDPFPPDRWRLTGQLAGRLHTPLAAGEDAAGPAALAELADVVGVLRVDPSASGGFAAILDAVAVVAAREVTVMTHAFPDQHAHLAGAPAVGVVEMIPDHAINPVGRLLARRQQVDAGELVLSEDPGHGAPLDWTAIERHARQTRRLSHGRGEG